MKMCENCKNEEFKNVKKRHVVKTRHTERPELVIENLEVEECKVCGSFTIPESSEKMIEILRKAIRKDMEERATTMKSPEKIEQSVERNFLQKAIRLITGTN